MDSLTQIVLGASVGELVLGKKVGNRAMLWGAIGGTIPDLDVIGEFFLSQADAVYFHRGFMHSLVFCVLFAPVLGYIIYKISRKEKATWREWTNLSFWTLVTHPLLDIFTTWGTQFLWPFKVRLTLNSIFVIDPLYTVPFLVFLIVILFKHRENSLRRKLNGIALTLSTSYLLLSVVFHRQAMRAFELTFENIPAMVLNYEVKPMPFTTFYWECLVEVDTGFYNGYYSFFQEKDTVIYRYIPKNHSLADSLGYAETETFKTLQFISKGYYALEKTEKGLNFMDLRFGQTDGIYSGETPKSIFIYELEKAGNEVHCKRVHPDYKNGFSNLGEYFGKVFGNVN